MSSTVTTGKLIGAFRGQDGQPCYVMFEQTYEKNCYPHTPRWSARAIGSSSQMMRAIFCSAASCEGQSLQGAGGRTITPESYVAGWLKEMANPVTMVNQEIVLKAGNEWNSPLTLSAFNDSKAAMQALGYGTQVAALEAGEPVALSLYADSNLLSALYDGLTLGAYRVIQSYNIPLGNMRDESLGYSPQKAKAYEVTSPRCMQVRDNDNVLMLGNEGKWRCEGWAYSIVAQFVASLWEAEIKDPGSYRKRIQALRASVLNAEAMPTTGVRVIVDTTVKVEDYKQRTIERLLAKVEHSAVGQEIHFAMPQGQDEIYSLTQFPAANTTWVIEDNPAPKPTPQQAPMEQLSFLAG
jgi:hypothetical protein